MLLSILAVQCLLLLFTFDFGFGLSLSLQTWNPFSNPLRNVGVKQRDWRGFKTDLASSLIKVNGEWRVNTVFAVSLELSGYLADTLEIGMSVPAFNAINVFNGNPLSPHSLVDRFYPVDTFKGLQFSLDRMYDQLQPVIEETVLRLAKDNLNSLDANLLPLKNETDLTMSARLFVGVIAEKLNSLYAKMSSRLTRVAANAISSERTLAFEFASKNQYKVCTVVDAIEPQMSSKVDLIVDSAFDAELRALSKQIAKVWDSSQFYLPDELFSASFNSRFKDKFTRSVRDVSRKSLQRLKTIYKTFILDYTRHQISQAIRPSCDEPSQD